MMNRLGTHDVAVLKITSAPTGGYYAVIAHPDTLAMTQTEREQYLAERFTAGNLDLILRER